MKIWRIVTCADDAAVARMARECGVPAAVATVLVNRGIDDPEAADRFLHPRLSLLEDPYVLPNMQAAVDATWSALGEGWPMAVYGDYDVDGITSTALVVHVLRRLGGKVTSFLPHRMNDGYGLSPGALSRCFKACSPRMILTVDCGTGSVEAVEWAREQGVDVVVTDHHEPVGPLAPALAVVNPKLEEEGDARDLAGVGVAFKLCHALLKRARQEKHPGAEDIDLREYLDWVAIGTICDVVPLRGENRILARHGLDRLGRTGWIGLRALMDKAKCPERVGSYHVGFLIGPRLNAAGRLGTAEAALELLLTEDKELAQSRAQELDTANRERRKIEADTVEAAREEFDGIFDPEKDFGLVAAGKGWHRGVVGIVASRLCSQYYRPTVVMAIEEDGSARGSCRSIEEFDMMDGLEKCASLLDTWGGHSMAAGVELPTDRIDAFKARFNEVAREALAGRDLRPTQRIDAWIDAGQTDEKLYEAIEGMGPFGLGNARPVWGVRGARIVGKPRVVGKKHLKLTLAVGGVQRQAIAFGMGDRVIPDGPIDVAFQLQRNEFRGSVTYEFNIQDFREAEG